MSNLAERNVSIVHATAVGFWIAGLLMIIGELAQLAQTCDLGLFTAGVGGVLTIRGYLCHLHDREVAAFEIGRQAGGIKSVR